MDTAMRNLLTAILVFLTCACTQRPAPRAPEKWSPDSSNSLLDTLDRLNEVLADTNAAIATSKPRLLEGALGKEKADELRKNFAGVVDQFTNGKTEAERLQAAWYLSLAGVLSSLPDAFGKDPALSSVGEFQKTVEQAKELTAKYEEIARRFETNWDAGERARIAAGHPYALIPLGGTLSTMSPLQYSEKEYQALVQKTDVEKLHSQSLAWMTLPSFYEGKLRPIYTARVIELLNQSPKYADIREPMVVYYQVWLQTMKRMDEANKARSEERRKEAEDLLVSQGTPKEKILAYIFELVKLAPTNLTQMNIAFYKRVKQGVTQVRLERIASLARQYRTRYGKLPTSVDELKLPVPELARDAENIPIELIHRAGVFQVRSVGRDGEPETNDDVTLPVN